MHDAAAGAMSKSLATGGSRVPRDFEVRLVAVGAVDRGILEFLAVTIRDDLGLRCRVGDGSLNIGNAFESMRQQYDATEILSGLLSLKNHDHEKVLGVADVDLFIPVLTFVFGQAQLRGPAALMSVRRLRQEFYGLPASEEMLFLRAEKEAIHELGHAFGLVHCRNFECVMHFSNSIEQVDLKSGGFCENCALLWRQAVMDSQT